MDTMNLCRTLHLPAGDLVVSVSVMTLPKMSFPPMMLAPRRLGPTTKEREQLAVVADAVADQLRGVVASIAEKYQEER